jgi:hypothetical protein
LGTAHYQGTLELLTILKELPRNGKDVFATKTGGKYTHMGRLQTPSNGLLDQRRTSAHISGSRHMSIAIRLRFEDRSKTFQATRRLNSP